VTDCAYCDKGGANFCIRSHTTADGPDSRVMAHRACAQQHGVTVLYEVLPERRPAPERAQ
jgi:hypothetical protein